MPTHTKLDTAAEKKLARQATSDAVRKSAPRLHTVIKYPDPILMKKGEPVTEFTPELAQFVEEMFDSMYAAQGIGLAAPQISVSRQITIIDISFKERPEDKLVLINPEVIDRKGKQFEDEGCLSLPEIYEKVQRDAWVKVRAQNVKGEFFEVEGEELLAPRPAPRNRSPPRHSLHRSPQPPQARPRHPPHQEAPEERRLVALKARGCA